MKSANASVPVGAEEKYCQNWGPWKLWPTPREIEEENKLQQSLHFLYSSYYDEIQPHKGSGVLVGRIRGWRWEKIRRRIFARDNYTCLYCDDFTFYPECDHIIPITRGGTNEDSNLATACFSCNRSKRCLLLIEWRDKFAL